MKSLFLRTLILIVGGISVLVLILAVLWSPQKVERDYYQDFQEEEHNPTLHETPPVVWDTYIRQLTTIQERLTASDSSEHITDPIAYTKERLLGLAVPYEVRALHLHTVFGLQELYDIASPSTTPVAVSQEAILKKLQELEMAVRELVPEQDDV
jgi:hypothetical protein